jgi:hypothetical protein
LSLFETTVRVTARGQQLHFRAERAGPTGRKPRHPVSNAVALADILRCPVVVADQAAGQKDV